MLLIRACGVNIKRSIFEIEPILPNEGVYEQVVLPAKAGIHTPGFLRRQESQSLTNYSGDSTRMPA